MTNSPYKAVWIATAPRTGSMWAYYVTRRILTAGGNRVRHPPSGMPERQWPDFAREIINEDAADVVCCIKIHAMLRLDIPKTRFIVTYRDVRDAALSIMRFMHLDFAEGLRRAETMMRVTDHYFQAPDDVAFKLCHDDIGRDPAGVIGRIADFLDIPLATDRAGELAASVTRERVAALVDDHTRSMQLRLAPGERLTAHEAAKNADGSIRFIEPNTGFQTGHVTSAGDGEWREVLSEDQRERLNALTGDWLRRYGFAVD